MRQRTILSILVLVSAALTIARADEVTDWERTFLNASVTAGTSPFVLTRYAAIFHASVFDAVNGVNPKYAPVHVQPAAPPGASVRAAAVMAAYTALVALYPSQKTNFDAILPGSLAGIASGPAAEHSTSIERGIAWGQNVANAILALRANDGSTAALPPYTGGNAPGQWRPTPPAFAPGVALAYAKVTPWVMASPSQFRPGPPPALTSVTYAANFNEIKAMGSIASLSRTADETLYAQFWQTSTVTWFWERVAMQLAAEHNFTLADNAHLLALLGLAMADATIATFDAKYAYSFWRPVTAIRAADTDGNPATDIDPSWTPLIVTPAHPEYPSAHLTFSSAGTAVLANVFGENSSFTVDSATMTGVTRSFTSFSAAIAELKNARIFGGIHYRNSCNVGQVVGEAVGAYVLENALRRVPGIH